MTTALRRSSKHKTAKLDNNRNFNTDEHELDSL